MAEQSTESLRGLIQGVLEDTRDLIRAELALARAEIREEVAAVTMVATAFGGAVFAGALGVMLLALTIGGAIAYMLSWPSWAGYGIVAVALMGAAWLLVSYGRAQLKKIRTLPKTTQTMKENLEWIQNKRF
jgi:putative superfamily III holin-X